jgi:glycosyltransferase involved in cell wall biosynthesis
VSSAAPSVSVLLAARDAERFLRLAIESVLRQTISDLELIVVDDDSTDATSDVLASIADPRLVVVRNAERLGLAGSLNRGLELARAPLLARMDADDVAFPRWLERQLEELHARPDLAVVGAGVLQLDQVGRPGSMHLLPRGSELRWHALFSSPFLHNTVVLDRGVLESHGLRYDTSFEESEDYDLWTRLLAVANGDNVPEPLVLHRIHPAQASVLNQDVQRAFQRQLALREIASVAPDLGPARAELAWRVGAREPISSEELDNALDAYLELVRAFEVEHGTAARPAAAAALVALARAAGRGDAARILREAGKLDPAFAPRGVTRRAQRTASARAARRDTRRWLAELDIAVGGRPFRVTAVFPEPTPYRAPLLDRLSDVAELELTVLYAAETVAARTWRVEPRHRAVFLRGLRIPGADKILRHDYPLTPNVARALAATRPDVVVVSGWSTFAAQAAIAWCRLRGDPYVLVVESHDEDARPAWRRAIKDAVVPPVVQGSSGVLVTGSLARRSMLARGADPDRVRVFANTVDVEAFAERADELATGRPELREVLGAGPDDIIVLSVGRLVPDKGMDLLVQAVSAAADARLLLVLAGDGPERTRLEQTARGLGVRLVLAGERAWEDVIELYTAADVFALLSTREPWGVVVNEAAACGLPLVLSDRVGAAHDLLRHDENGLLVPAGDVITAAAAISRLAGDSALRASFGARSRAIARTWGYEPSVEAFLAAVREAATRPRG